MKWIGYRQVAMKSIVVDAPDIRRRMKAPNVVELADNVATSGNEEINAPVVRDPMRTLTCGRDRYAAAMLNKRKRIWVHLFSGTDEEAIDLEASENVHRRSDNRTELLARASLARAELLRQTAAQGVTGVITTQSVKAQARREVAKAAGVTPAAVKRAEQRAKAKDVAPRGHGVAGDPPTGQESPHETPAEGDNLPAFEPEAPRLPKSFDTFGIAAPQVNVQLTIDTMTNLGMWDQQVRGLLSYLTRFEGREAALAGGHVQAIREALQGAGHAIRNAVPVRLCFYCKGRADLRAGCFACGQTGVMGRNDGENAPAELRETGKAAQVATGGKFVPYDGVAVPGLSPKKTARKVSVLDEAGRELVIDRTEAQ